MLTRNRWASKVLAVRENWQTRATSAAIACIVTHNRITKLQIVFVSYTYKIYRFGAPEYLGSLEICTAMTIMIT